MDRRLKCPVYRCFDIGGSGVKTALYNPMTHKITNVEPLGVAPVDGNTETFTNFIKQKIPSYASEIETVGSVLYIVSAGNLVFDDKSKEYVIRGDWKGGGIERYKKDWPADKQNSGYLIKDLFGVKDPNVTVYCSPDKIAPILGYRMFVESARSKFIANITLGTGVVCSIVKKEAGTDKNIQLCMPMPFVDSLTDFKLKYTPNLLHPEDPYYKPTSDGNEDKEIWSLLGFGDYDPPTPGLQTLKTTKTPDVYKQILTKRLVQLINFLNDFITRKRIIVSEILVTGSAYDFIDASQLGREVVVLNDPEIMYRGIQYALTKNPRIQIYDEVTNCNSPSGGTLKRRISHNRRKTLKIRKNKNR